MSSEMKVIEADCTNCCRRESFELVGRNKYKCISCEKIMHKCKANDCNKMIEHGLFCSKCIGDGLKKGGALVTTVIVGGVVVGGKYVLVRKGSNKG